MLSKILHSVFVKNRAVALAVLGVIVYALLERFVLPEYNFRNLFILTLLLSTIAYIIIGRYPVRYRYDTLARVLASLSIGVILISTILSRDIVSTLIGSTHYGDGSLLLLVFLVFCILVFKRIQIGSDILKKTYIVLISINVLSLCVGVFDIGYSARLGGIFQQPILIAVYSGLSIIIGCYLYQYKIISKKVFLWCGVVSIVTLLLTQTRASIIYIFVFLVYWVWAYRQAIRSAVAARQKLLLTVSIALAVLGVLILAGIPAFVRTFNVDRFVYGLKFRAQLISYATAHNEYIPLTGLGKDNAPSLISYEVYEKYPELIKKAIVTDNVSIESVHNYFVDMWLQFGCAGVVIVGLALLLTSMVYISRERTVEIKIAGAILLFLLVQLMVTHTYFVIQAVVIMALFVLLRQPKKDIPTSNDWDLPSVLIVLLTSFVFSYMQSNSIHTKVLNKIGVFPLDTNKTELDKGTTYHGQTLVWEPIEESYHHSYKAADIHVPEGTIVQSAVAGQVVAKRDISCDGKNQFPYIQIKGFDGFYYLYSHLGPGSISKNIGETVETGEQIAAVGSAECAQSSASHLHFDVTRFGFLPRNTWLDDYNFIDPQPMLRSRYQSLEN